MSRWIVIGAVSAASSAAAAFVTSGFPRDVMVAIAALSAILLSYWGARSEARVEEAHRRILQLSRDVEATALMASVAHQLADRSVLDRQMEEQYEEFVKPIDDTVKRAARAIVAFFRGPPAAAADNPVPGARPRE